MRKVKGFLIISLFSCTLYAQSPDNNGDSPIRYGDYTYKDYIKSVQIHQPGWKFSPPVMALNSGDQLQLEFDDLQGDYKNYSYTLVHCDANWQPSDMVAYDYLNGFSQDNITNYAYSYNTSQKYTHYILVLPNSNISVKVSGNYLLKVFTDNDPDSIVITRRIMVYETGVAIKGREKPGIGEDIFTKQLIDFTINTSRMNIADPFSALQVFVIQNGRLDNAIVGPQPQFASNNLLEYNNDYGIAFDGGNQFRSFDMTSLRYLTQYEDAFLPNKNSYEIQLKPDVPHAGEGYFTFQDIDGQFLIMNKDYDSSNISSEYVYIHFFMPLDSEITTGNLYIFGQLSDWQCKPDFQMHYDSVKKGYTGVLYLKQGYYEYQYAYLANGSKIADITYIEGNHSETTNTYYIYAYYRPVGLLYDRLIGYSTIHAPGN